MSATRLSIRRYGPDQAAHAHAFHQLVLPREGGLAMELGPRGAARAGRVEGLTGVIVPAGERHGFLGVGENRFLILDVDGETAAEPAFEPLWEHGSRGGFFRQSPDLDRLLAWAERRPAETRASGAFARHFAGLYLLSLSAELGRAETTLPRRLARALDYLSAHLAEPLRVADVAAAVNLSESRLQALFRAGLGRSVHRCLADLRLDRAQELLATSDLSLAEVALQSGHADQSALTRALSRRRGVTPGRYRRQIRR